ncbi:MAG: AAA family ATPase [Alphaproteobacteria bacterium]
MPRLKTLTAEELLRLELKPREYALAPILPFPGLAMIYAARGLGKTYVALSVSHAIASGGRALRWDAPRPLRVLHIDGEMPAPALQERLAQVVAGSGVALPDENRLRFVIGDLALDGLPNIADPEGMRAIEQAAADSDVILLDNLSTLAFGMRENEADDWGRFQPWLMRMRRAGKLVIIIHHAGKGGNQRGTSRREDALDTVIALRRSKDYNPEEGARFELHIEKARGAMGAAVAPFEARLTEGEGGGLTWAMTDLQTAQKDRAITLLTEGESVRDVAEAVGMSKSAVQRLKTAEGL